MPDKLNLGAGPWWSKAGWQTADHKSSQPRSAGNTKFQACSFDVVFSSHMLEHVPHFRISAVLRDINRVLRPGGTLRLLCPDLAKVARIFVEGDQESAKQLLAEDPSLRTDLGLGGLLVNLVVSPGRDTFLFDRNGKFIGGYAHLYAYDFEMLSTLLERNGFKQVRQMGFCKSEVPDFHEPLHLAYREPVWVNEQDWEVDQERGPVTTGFDRDPFHSLIVEAVSYTHLTLPTISRV